MSSPWVTRMTGEGSMDRPSAMEEGHGAPFGADMFFRRNPARRQHIVGMPMLKKYPFYLRATVILFGLVLCSYALANLREILIPFSFALFLAILLNPLTDLLMRWKVPKVPAIALSLLIAIIVIAAVWYFLANQIMRFTDQLPVLEKKATELMSRLQQGLVHQFNIPMEKQN